MIGITYVTITYQAAKVLQRTLDSVLQQDYPEITHLIIDGASTDGTLDLINNYIERSNAADCGHKVLLMSEPDNGIYDAMNKGLRSLTGDYVCFLNAGDFLPSPDTVSKIVSAGVRSQESVVNCLRYYTVILTLSMARAVFSTTAVWHRQNISRGSRSVRACSSVIRPSMPVPTLPSPRLTTSSTAILPMSTGVSVS